MIVTYITDLIVYNVDFRYMKDHWENIYKNKADNEVSWYQTVPKTSIELIEKHHATKKNVIDVGGGNSNLTKTLIEKGYDDLTVLDISSAALERSKSKLAEKSILAEWIESDITSFKSNKQYEIWHDRAVFHFLTEETDITKYIEIVTDSLNTGGLFVLATFSVNGPLKCSGLEVSQYDQSDLVKLFSNQFNLIDCFEEDHITPFDTSQRFIYSVWRKNNRISFRNPGDK